VDAIILAAGTGSRLLNLTREEPKALLRVSGRPLIEYALSFVNVVGCERVIVVGGFYFDQMKTFLHGKKNVSLIENNDFLKGSILTIHKALPLVQDSFLVMNVDHIYPDVLAKKLSQDLVNASVVTAIVDFDRPLLEDDMKVLLDQKGRIRTIAKALSDFDAGYIGMTYVPKASLSLYKSAVERVLQTDGRSNIESVLQILADDGTPPTSLDASGIRWLEVDNQNDLLNAERILRHLPKFLS